MDETKCPFCDSTDITFYAEGNQIWYCSDCRRQWDKFEEGMKYKIGINCKWGMKKKWRKELPENHMHGEVWCHRPSNYPFQTLKPFTCRCKEFKDILSDIIDCNVFWNQIGESE